MGDERVQAVVQRWPVVVAAVVVALLGALLTASTGTGPALTRYQAQHLLYTGGDVLPGGIPLPTLALLSTVGEVPANAVDRLGADVDPAVLAAQVNVEADPELGTLTVTTANTDPDEAVRLADEYAAAVLDFVAEQSEERRQQSIESATAQLASQETRIAELEAELVQLPPDSAQAGLVRAERDGLIRQYGLTLQELEDLNDPSTAQGNLYTLQSATPIPIQDDEFISAPTGTGTRLAIAAIVGLLGGIGLTLLLDRVDTSIRTRRDAERAFGLPVIAEVPAVAKSVLRQGPVTAVERASHAAESYRLLRTAVQLMPRWVLSRSVTSTDDIGQPEGATTRDGDVQAVLVTSAEPAQGKTTTAVDLAISFAELGASVVIVDCDFRHPTVHTRTSVSAGPGVTDYQVGAEDESFARVLHGTKFPGVRVAPAGGPRAGGALPQLTSTFIDDLRAIADVIVVDSGPLLTVNDAASLIPSVDAVVLTAKSGSATVDGARRVRDMLARLEAQVLGVVLTAVPRTLLSQRPSSRYYGPPPRSPRPAARPDQPKDRAKPGSWSIGG